MVWHEPRNHSDDCYFCLLNVAGLNAKKRKIIVYPDLPSALRPVLHSEVLPVPMFKCLPELPITIRGGNEIAGPCQRELRPESISNISDHQQTSSGTEESQTEESNDESILSPQCFNQEELSDLVRDLGLSKELSEVLASRLKEKNLLERGTSITFYRTSEQYLLPFFTQEKTLVFCNDVSGLLRQMGVHVYIPTDWRLFIDSSKRSLKCVLLHNGNE